MLRYADYHSGTNFSTGEKDIAADVISYGCGELAVCEKRDELCLVDKHLYSDPRIENVAGN